MTLHATITSPAGVVNEGTETFTILSGMTPIGDPVTVGVSAGAASARYALPVGTPAGTYAIQAVFNGTPNFAESTDNSHTLTVNETPAHAYQKFYDLNGNGGVNTTDFTLDRQRIGTTLPKTVPTLQPGAVLVDSVLGAIDQGTSVLPPLPALAARRSARRGMILTPTPATTTTYRGAAQPQEIGFTVNYQPETQTVGVRSHSALSRKFLPEEKPRP